MTRRRHPPTSIVILTSLALAGMACEREERRFSESPPSATPLAFASVSELQPGPTFVRTTVEEPYGDIAYSVSEGKRYFNWMNCSGCHSNGGGGMGPALMDDEWLYGSDPEQIFATIAEGRPNGMPSFKYRLSNQQIWQLVAYVRSLSSLNPKGARSGRDEHMQVKPAEMQTPNAQPKNTLRP